MLPYDYYRDNITLNYMNKKQHVDTHCLHSRWPFKKCDTSPEPSLLDGSNVSQCLIESGFSKFGRIRSPEKSISHCSHARNPCPHFLISPNASVVYKMGTLRLPWATASQFHLNRGMRGFLLHCRKQSCQVEFIAESIRVCSLAWDDLRTNLYIGPVSQWFYTTKFWCILHVYNCKSLHCKIVSHKLLVTK